MSLTNLLVPTYTSMLNALAGWLDKAQQHLADADPQALLAARLAPDMFPLATQVWFTCRQAQEATYRLTGSAFPQSINDLLTQGLNAQTTPGSFADVRNAVADTLALLASLAPDALDMDPDAPLEHELPNGMIFDFTAGQYARDWALPQFYFHLMAAYAILRSQNVPLGKIDYIPHLLPCLRQQPDPAG